MNNIETVKLKNGLTIYLLQDLRKHSTYFEFSVFCGGATKHFMMDKKEYNLQDGVAHILEHYIVECNDQGNFLEKLGQKQMNTNASTNMIDTSYYFETVEKVSYGINTLLNGIHHVKFDKKKLDKLKNPIYQEIRENLDNKFYHLNRIRIKNLFHNSEYRDTGGTLEEIEKTTIKDLQLLYNAFYQPTNEFITIVGNFDRDEVLSTINKFYKTNKIKKHDTQLLDGKDKRNVAKKEESFEFDTPMEFVDISFKIDTSIYSPVERLDLDFYLQSFLNSSFSPESPLYQKLVDEKIILEPLHIKNTPLEHFVIISIGGYTNEREKLKEKILQEVSRRKNLDKEKFELDKASAMISFILRDENIFKMIGPFLNNVVFFNYPYLDKIEDIEKLNYKEYKEMITYLDMSHYTITNIIKKKG